MTPGMFVSPSRTLTACPRSTRKRSELGISARTKTSSTLLKAKSGEPGAKVCPGSASRRVMTPLAGARTTIEPTRARGKPFLTATSDEASSQTTPEAVKICSREART